MLHQRRLSSPPASALPERYAEAITTSSSAPSRAGEWDSHQRTSRMSRLGSASGSQPGQYVRATLAVSGRKSVNAALLMSLHLLPLRCRARSGGFAVYIFLSLKTATAQTCRHVTGSPTRSPAPEKKATGSSPGRALGSLVRQQAR